MEKQTLMWQNIITKWIIALYTYVDIFDSLLPG